jgi:L-lactate dehydrogenase (cytochrome)
MDLQGILALKDFEPAARRKLPRSLYGFVAGGAEDGRSPRANLAAFDEYGFSPRVLVNVSTRSQATTLFGKRHASPMGIAPMGAAGLCWYEADLALARAAEVAEVPFVLSGASTVALERVIEQAPGAWYQAYLPADRGRIERLLERIRVAGYEVLVVTVDVPVGANRENNVRNGFSIPLRPSLRLAFDALTHPRWMLETLAATLLHAGVPHFENFGAERGKSITAGLDDARTLGRDALSWSDLAWIRKRWNGPLVLKGVLNVEDARQALAASVDGIIVSNHGGRQLDGAASPLRALPAIAEAAGDLVVMIDGGIRRGTDVLKALALGAEFVFVGRPMLFGAALAGEAGVLHALSILRQEIDRDLALLGCTDIASVNRSLLVPQ